MAAGGNRNYADGAKPAIQQASTIPTESSVNYWRDRPHPLGADLALRQIMLELLRHVGAEQARALCFAAGARIAAESRLDGIDKLGEMEQSVNKFLRASDWGWLRVEEREESVDFLHGCSPLRAWFGEESLGWAAGLLEGMYAEWLQQLGAGERLQLRQVDAPKGDDDLICFRLMHESRFAA